MYSAYLKGTFDKRHCDDIRQDSLAQGVQGHLRLLREEIGLILAVLVSVERRAQEGTCAPNWLSPSFCERHLSPGKEKSLLSKGAYCNLMMLFKVYKSLLSLSALMNMMPGLFTSSYMASYHS